MPSLSDVTERFSSALKVGQRLEVAFAGDWLVSRLEDFSNDAERLTIAWPTDRDRRLIPLKVGQHLEVATTAAQDALYSAQTLVERSEADNIPLLTLKVVGPWQRSQRRLAVRIPVAIRPRVAVLISEGKKKALRAGISNLSATGVQVRSQDEVKPNDLLELAFTVLDVDQEIECQARVRRVQQHDRGELHYWEAGCAFEGLPDRLSQRLVQFIFNQQRALARARRNA